MSREVRHDMEPIGWNKDSSSVLLSSQWDRLRNWIVLDSKEDASLDQSFGESFKPNRPRIDSRFEESIEVVKVDSSDRRRFGDSEGFLSSCRPRPLPLCTPSCENCKTSKSWLHNLSPLSLTGLSTLDNDVICSVVNSSILISIWSSARLGLNYLSIIAGHLGILNLSQRVL